MFDLKGTRQKQESPASPLPILSLSGAHTLVSQPHEPSQWQTLLLIKIFILIIILTISRALSHSLITQVSSQSVLLWRH